MSRSARSDDAALEVFLALSEPMLAAVRIAQQPEVRPEAARTLFDEQLRALRSAAERRRLPLAHVDDVVYALAAHADEAMIARPGTREAWLPRLLQLSLFGACSNSPRRVRSAFHAWCGLPPSARTSSQAWRFSSVGTR